MSEQRRGILYGAASYVLWGLFPLYWPLLKPSGALEILAHRVVWSLGVVLVILAAQRRWGWIRDIVRSPRRLGLLAVAAVVIAVNWGTYIWAVNNDHVVEASLGYFINPIITVLMGVIVLGERLRVPQWVAIGIGAAAVVVLTIGYGRLPWVALVLAVSFGTYGLLKKLVGVDAVQSLTVETAVLFLPALGYLVVLQARGGGTFGQVSTGHSTLLALSGLVTAVPLLFFGSAARTLPLTTLGLLQYLAPVLQFAFGVLLFHEPMPLERLAGFALVWVALVVLTLDGVTRRRRQPPKIICDVVRRHAGALPGQCHK